MLHSKKLVSYHRMQMLGRLKRFVSYKLIFLLFKIFFFREAKMSQNLGMTKDDIKLD